MDCEQIGEGIIISGNFAERTKEMPKDFDHTTTGKWYAPYTMQWRETLGGTICSCKQVKVNFAPYYGYDYFHMDYCNLMKKLRDYPQIESLVETYLPAMHQYHDAVPADTHTPLYIKGRSSKGKRIPVNVTKGEQLDE